MNGSVREETRAKERITKNETINNLSVSTSKNDTKLSFVLCNSHDINTLQVVDFLDYAVIMVN